MITKVIQYDMDGVNMGEIELPGLGTASGWKWKKRSSKFYISVSQTTIPLANIFL